MNVRSYLTGFTGGFIVLALLLAGGMSVNAQKDGDTKNHWLNNPQVIEHKAEKLGMTIEELTSALESGKNFREIAEEQGVDLSGFQKNHKFGKFGNHGNWSFDKGKHLAKFAEKLGITEAELQAALDSGETIKEIAEEEGVELQCAGKRGFGGRWHKNNNEE